MQRAMSTRPRERAAKGTAADPAVGQRFRLQLNRRERIRQPLYRQCLSPGVAAAGAPATDTD